MTDVTTDTDIDQRLVRAIGNPLRQRILRQLQVQTASPSQLARALDEPLGKVSYHVGVLLENEAIELVSTRPVRGALEHFYRPLTRPFFDDRHWAKLPASLRQSLFGQTLMDMFAHVAAASRIGGFEDPETHASWTTLELDDVGYEKVVELLADLLDDIADVQSDALARMDGAPSTRRTEVAVLHFDREPTAQD